MDLEKSKKLFEEFPPVSTHLWEERINLDLKGADYEKKLVWKTDEGISVRPYYRAEDLAKLPYNDSLPGQYPFVRGNKAKDNSWKIRQNIDVSNIIEANRLATEALQKGATALSVDVGEVRSAADLDLLLQNISPVETDIHYYGARNYKMLMHRLMEICNKRGLDSQNMVGSIDFDPYSFVLLHGDFYQSQEADLGDAADLVESFSNIAPAFRLLSVNGQYLHNSGSNIVQELAFSMASASDYVARISEMDVPANQIMPRITFIFAVGSDYFLEIAKLRAARLLWTRIAEQYHPAKKPESLVAHIQAVTSCWNKTIYDPYVNLLRTTTETMAAAIAGVESIAVEPFDNAFKDPDNFSRRIARNQQILLKEESYLDKVIDPSAGSYYIEQLTSSLAAHAWDLFVKVEQMGGMLEAIKSGYIQDEIAKTANKRMQDVATRKKILLGTNQFPNLQEYMLQKIQEEPTDQFQEAKTGTKYKTIAIGRAADAIEDLRLATEIYTDAGNKQPKVFLFTIGNLAMRKARAAFSSSFFGCVGYQVLDNPGFNTVDEGLQAVSEESPDIVVLCSSDEEYSMFVPELCKKINVINCKAILVLAGFPKEHIENFRNAGIEEFIHVRSNLQQTLAWFQNRLGIFDEEM